MIEEKRKLSLGLALLVGILGVLVLVMSTNDSVVSESEPMLGVAQEVGIDEIGPPPILVIDPDLALSGALTIDGNFFKFERNIDIPDDLDLVAGRESWTTIVSDEEHDSILDFLNENTDLLNQLTLIVYWDADDQDWQVYPNEIFRSRWNIETLDIFRNDFDSTLIVNTNEPFAYADNVEERVGELELFRGWNLGPLPDFNDIEGRRVTFWSGELDGTARRLTSRFDIDEAVDKDFYDDLDKDKVYWFYVHREFVSCDCNDADAPVCGKDGNTYMNTCKAVCSNIDVDYNGKCKIDRNALLPKLKQINLLANETLVLEFFEDADDTTAESIDVLESEIDIDDENTDLSIYNIDSSTAVKVTALSNADVDVSNSSIKVDLDDDLAPGKYELRIKNTFEREKIIEAELGFNVVQSQVAEALTIANGDNAVAITFGEILEFASGNSESFSLSDGFSLNNVVKVERCENASTCDNPTDVTEALAIEITNDGNTLRVPGLGDTNEIVDYRIEVKEGLEYFNRNLVAPKIYLIIVNPT